MGQWKSKFQAPSNQYDHYSREIWSLKFVIWEECKKRGTREDKNHPNRSSRVQQLEFDLPNLSQRGPLSFLLSLSRSEMR